VFSTSAGTAPALPPVGPAQVIVPGSHASEQEYTHMKRVAFLGPIVFACTLAACDSSNIDSPDSVRLSVLLTDAPGDFSAAVVTISSIYLQADETEDNEGGRIVLLDDPVTTDLLTLVADFETLVDGMVVPEGTYGQLRFVIDGAYIEVETQTGVEVYATQDYEEAPGQVDGTLMCPSCGESGIKVNFVGGLTIGDEDETVVVDFDVSETFGHQAGNSGMWIMHPSLKAASLEAVASLEVRLGLESGVSLPIIGGGAVTLGDFEAELRGASADPNAPGEIVLFTDADSDGTFEASFDNVVPGDYVIVVRGPLGLSFGTSPSVPMTVSIDAEASATADFTITSATLAN
jgi:hypothetical protein